MSGEEIRAFLYYPLGMIPSIFFTVRILLQWIQSEKKGFSYVGKLFWRLSLFGNLFLMIHYTIQVQYPFALIQALNAVISWRNLDLMGRNKLSQGKTVRAFFGAFALLTVAFLMQSYYLIGEIDWIRTPVKGWDMERVRHPLSWHLLGAVGTFLFASRFWIQWWNAERSGKSELTAFFWWISLGGSLLSLIYFLRLGDTVSIINYGFGLIPYIRNLMLLNRPHPADT